MRLRRAGGPSRQKPASLAMCADAPHYQTLIKATQEREKERERGWLIQCRNSSFLTSCLFFTPDTPSYPPFSPFSVTALPLMPPVLHVKFSSYALLLIPCLSPLSSFFSVLPPSLPLALSRSIFPPLTHPPTPPPLILSRCCAAAPRGSQRWEMY